jgi:hypothetical protein
MKMPDAMSEYEYMEYGSITEEFNEYLAAFYEYED